MSNPVVKIREGELKGVENTNSNGTKYYSFLGIPYAEPPLGKLRFKDPVPKEPWTGIKDATEAGSMACQCEMNTRTFFGNEDCLFVNVYTTQLPSEKKEAMPVMVFIHGGGFVYGAGTDAGPEYIIEGGIVFVTLNYRLGIMGFLCTDSKNAHGDMGLKDQNLALKWVKQNISAFNGDPDNITLFGISAGSASVEYHLLSSQSSGLFHKAILQSGSCSNPWARTRNGVEKAKRVAEALGYKEGDLFEFLNGFSAEELCSKSSIILDDDCIRQGEYFPFAPVINELKDYDGFIKGEPIELLKNGEFNKMPTMWGICEKEGMMYEMFYTGNLLTELNEGHLENFVPNYLVNNPQELKTKLGSIYNGNKIDLLSDVFINGGVWASMSLRMNHNKNTEYSYMFSYDGNLNFVKHLMNLKVKGACHGDDTAYLFTNMFVNRDVASPTDLVVSSRMIKMWTNFAKTNDPTPKTSDILSEKWIPATKANKKYMEIGTNLKMEENLWPERIQLWTELYTKQKQNNFPLKQKL